MKSGDQKPFAGCLADATSSLETHRLVLFGIADDSRSSYRRGAAEGPVAVRSHYNSACYNSTSESGVDLGGRVIDAGDILPRSILAETDQAIRQATASWLAGGKVPFIIGGDHGVTVPVVAAFSDFFPRLQIVQIDAHPDLYPDFDGDPASHACVAARLLEFGHVSRLTQFGIRTFNDVQRENAGRHPGKIKVYEASRLDGRLPEIDPDLPVYLTVDLDGFDPGFAPAVSHPVPGGLNPRQLINWILNSQARLVGMDVVELNPGRDEGGRTAVLAGRLLHEGMAWASRASSIPIDQG